MQSASVPNRILNAIWRNFLPLFYVFFMISGTAFYAVRGNLGWEKGFYTAISVGYSIGEEKMKYHFKNLDAWLKIEGWGYPKEQNWQCILFSIFYCLIGLSIICAFLAYFMDTLATRSKRFKLNKLVDIPTHSGTMSRICTKFNENKEIIISSTVWILLNIAMVIWATLEVEGWNVVDGIYCAVSTFGEIFFSPHHVPIVSVQYVCIYLSHWRNVADPSSESEFSICNR